MNWNEKTNEELLAGYQDGEFGAFDVFFKRNHKLVFYFILNKVNNTEYAEDILQETFCRLHKYILKYDDTQKAMTWVFTIAKNAMLTYLRKNQNSDESELIEAVDDKSSKNVNRLEIQRDLNKLMQDLDADERQLIYERFIEEKSFDEISSEKGIT